MKKGKYIRKRSCPWCVLKQKPKQFRLCEKHQTELEEYWENYNEMSI